MESYEVQLKDFKKAEQELTGKERVFISQDNNTRSTTIDEIRKPLAEQLNENTKDLATVKTDYAKKVDINTLASSKAEKVDLQDTNAELAIQKARIDTFTKLAEGSTTGDAELIDGRTDYNGNIHTNLGGHIRNITEEINKKILSSTIVKELNELTTKNGFVTDKGVWVDGENDYFKTTETISLRRGDTIRLRGVGQEKAISIITLYENSTHIPLVISIDSSVQNYEYTAKRSMNVLISYHELYGKIQIIHNVDNECKKVTGIINALDYGFVNDGKFDNDSVMDNYIANDYKTPIYFPSGTYKFTRGINFPDTCYVELGGNAEWLLSMPGDIIDYFVTIRKESTRSDYALGSYIRGGSINANYKANTILGFNKCMQTTIDHLIIKNAGKNGIVTDTTFGNADGQVKLAYLQIVNDYGKSGTVGINDNGWDTRGNNIEVINFETGLKTVCGRWMDLNCWIKSGNLVGQSTFAILDGFDIVFTNIAVDTYRYGFKTTMPTYGCTINGMIYTRNKGVYTDEDAELYPIILFADDYNDRIYRVNGLTCFNFEYLSWSSIPLTNSTFLNIHVKSTDPYNEIPNYRNDSDNLHRLNGFIGNPQTEYVTKSNDFDIIINNGIYPVNLWDGTDGNNAPNYNIIGVMLVFNNFTTTNKSIIQIIIGKEYTLQRIYCAGLWTEWKVIC